MSRFQRDERIKDPEKLIDEPLLIQIPSDPQPSEIIEILSKNPAVISYIGNLLADIELQISNTKLLITKKKRELEAKKSEIRLKEIAKYREELEKYLKTEPQKIKELMDKGYNRTEAKEIVRLQRPDKPRESDLSDKAEVETRMFVQTEIEPLEEQLIDLQKKYDDYKVKYNLFENNFKASQSIKGLLQRDRDNY